MKKILISILVVLCSISTYSQSKRDTIFIEVNKKDITLKLFRFKNNKLSIIFNVAHKWVLFDRQDNIYILEYTTKLNPTGNWADKTYPLKDLKFKAITSKEFIDRIKLNGYYDYLQSTQLNLIVKSKCSKSFEIYPVNYTGPSLWSPHDLIPEVGSKEK